MFKSKPASNVTDMFSLFESLYGNNDTVFNGIRYVIDERGDYGTWPHTNNAFVKFTYQPPDRPYKKVEGVQVANTEDVICQVVSWADHTILDPADGKVKRSDVYGTPAAWVSYEAEEVALKKNKAPLVFSHTMDGVETLWDVARKYYTTAERLIADNDIDDPRNLPAGTVILLPRTNKEISRVEYEVLEPTRQMHVSRPGGAKKWSFGNARNWIDIIETGPTHPLNENVEVVAIARVPLGKETAAYFMDAVSLGDYKNTGNVAWATGFSWQHLSDGYVQRSVAVKPKRPLSAPKPAPVSYKSTFEPLNDQRVPVQFIAKTSVMVKEHDGRRPDRALYEGQGVRIFGTFVKDGDIYGRTPGSVDSGLWYGVPMDILRNEDEIFKKPELEDIPTKVAMGRRLSLSERGLVVFAKAVNNKSTQNVFKKITKQKGAH